MGKHLDLVKSIGLSSSNKYITRIRVSSHVDKKPVLCSDSSEPYLLECCSKSASFVKVASRLIAIVGLVYRESDSRASLDPSHQQFHRPPTSFLNWGTQANDGLLLKRPKNSVSHPQTSKALNTNSSSQSEAFVPSQNHKCTPIRNESLGKID
ncbi:hypothetical protein LguiB_008918 [Lonicera macranthoides]